MDARLRLRWIVDARTDLTFFILPCLCGYALLWLHLGLGVSALALYWLWIVWLDGPHLFATVSRTYLDPAERRTRGPLLWASLLWFVPAPLCIALGLGLGSKLPYYLFLTAAQLWAYWHVVRQHYGFLALYQRKNGEPAGAQNPLESACFYVLLLCPFASYALRNPEARPQLRLPAALSQPEQVVVLGLSLATVAAALGLCFSCARDLRAGRLSLPKVLFLLACGPLHAVVLLHPRWSTLMPPLLLAVIVTSFHNLQYEGIVWYHNQNRHRQPDAPTNPYWRFVPLYGVGLLIAIAMRHATWVLDGRYPALTGVGLVKGAAGYTALELTAAFWWGVAMHHYYLDQKIWRVSKDSALQRTLRLPDKLAA